MAGSKRRSRRIISKGKSKADWNQCEEQTLKRYVTQKRLQVNVNTSREVLEAEISKHFATVEAPDESQAIYEFLHALRKKAEEKNEKESDVSK
eukprot:jgi/Ulvmu1/1876/UM012_0033.1